MGRRLQKTQEPKAKGRKQPESNTEYHAVPKDVDYMKCADVGYQDNNESRPYSHSLRMHLQNEDRCLVCWDVSHKIYNCPHRSEKLIHSFIHSFITRFPIRRSGALQQAFYGSPPSCPVLGFPPPMLVRALQTAGPP